MKRFIQDNIGLLIIPACLFASTAAFAQSGECDEDDDCADGQVCEKGMFVPGCDVGPDGDAVEQAPTREQRVMVQAVPLLSEVTPAVRYGQGIELAIVGTGVVALAWSLLRRRRADDRDPADSAPATRSADDGADQPAGTSPTPGAA